ncbi:MAG: DUF2071 domain-containing protein [Myxococcales bacterium]|nr:DUF2071 domain-containing protein [Myxococcales bacterium]
MQEPDRLAPADRPSGRPAGFQRWRKLLFLHWEVPVDQVAATLPAGLEPDLWEGKALVGLVPFTMRDVVPWWSPSVPGVSNFHELNMRTYVRHGSTPGVWFYSLDAANALAVVVARVGWKLPYHKAAMSLEEEDDGWVRYHSERRWPAPKPAVFAARYRVGEPSGRAPVGTLEHFLVERYVLFTMEGDQLLSGRVHHEPYPLSQVELDGCEQTIVAAQGMTPASEAPILAHYSEGVDVDVYALEPVA